MSIYIRYYVRLLQEKLKERVARNARYSLRAFAKLLKINPGHLSKIMSNQRPLTMKKAEEIAEIIKLNEEEKRFFLKSVELTHESIHNYSADVNLPIIYLDENFQHISKDIIYSHVLQACQSSSIRKDLASIARYVQLPEVETKKYLYDLMQIGCVKQIGTEYCFCKTFEIRVDHSTSNVEQFHALQITQIRKVLESAEFHERANRSGSILISKEKLPHYRIVVQDFLNVIKNMSTELDGGKEDELFGISFFLFPWQIQSEHSEINH